MFIGIVRGILLFSSDEFLSQLKLMKFKQDYSKFFGIIFIVCIALSIVYYFVDKVKYHFKKREFYKDIKEEAKS